MSAEEFGKLGHYIENGAQQFIDQVESIDMIGRGTATTTVPHRHGTATVTWTAKVVLDSGWGPWAGLSRWQALGLLPSTTDLWDLVPYGFVMDWVLPIASSIQKFETLSNVLLGGIRYCVLSKEVNGHCQGSFTLGTHAFNVNVTDNHYHRWVKYGLPLDMSLGTTAFSDPRKHGLAGSALLIQRV